MDDFGCAESNPRVLVGKGWPLRDDVTEADVRVWLEEYVAAGMAALWTVNERRYVHLTGWFGPHGQKKRVEYDPTTIAGRKGSKRKTPPPPADLVAAVLSGVRRAVDGKPPGTDREDDAESPNDSTPAREITGNGPGRGREVQVSRQVPAYAVPDAVPDAVAREAFAPSPSDSTPPVAEVSALDPEAEQTTTAARHETASGSASSPPPVLALVAEAPPSRPPDLSPVVAVLPCTGTGLRQYAVTEAQVAKWQAAFPGVAVQAEMPKMLVWLEANPTKVKTHRGMPAFCVRWLGKAQDDQRGGARPAAPGKRPGMAVMGSAESFAKDEKPW
jgi:hypothetical protein